MKEMKIGGMNNCSRIVYGCMRLGAMDEKDARRHLETAVEVGINYFDHADIYNAGYSEELFGKVFDYSKRDKVIIQSKCGIRKGYYDFSKEHIISSVEGSLNRLGTDYLDVLVLHRPDTLMEGEEVAAALDNLVARGLVRSFGVSNFRPMQLEYLKKYVSQPLLINQLQFGPAHTGMIDSGIHANMKVPAAVDMDGSVLEYSRVNDITIQAWSPFIHTKKTGPIIGNSEMAEFNNCIDKYSSAYGVTPGAVVAAWILRHPAGIQLISGTTNTRRLTDLCGGCDVEMSREVWYEIYRSAGNIIP